MCNGSVAPHISRAECIDSWGIPISIASIPSWVDVIGPIVDPHGTLLREANVCKGTPLIFAIERIWASPRAVVAYR